MRNTWDVAADTNAEHIARWVRQVALGTPLCRLATVVFSCHGSPGDVGIGRRVGVNDISRFEVWKDAGRPLVSKVWCRCCKVALIEAAGASNDGNVSCSRFAQTTGAYVTALSELHWSRSRTLPFGTIDQWEGLVLSCAPSGGVDSSTRFTSGWVDASGAGQYESPD